MRHLGVAIRRSRVGSWSGARCRSPQQRGWVSPVLEPGAVRRGILRQASYDIGLRDRTQRYSDQGEGSYNPVDGGG